MTLSWKEYDASKAKAITDLIKSRANFNNNILYVADINIIKSIISNDIFFNTSNTEFNPMTRYNKVIDTFFKEDSITNYFDLRVANKDDFYEYGSGYLEIYYDGIIYNRITFSIIIGNIIYIPNTTNGDSSSYVNTVKERLSRYTSLANPNIKTISNF